MLAALSEAIESINARAERLAELLRRELPEESFSVARDESFAGGGSLPAWPMPTAVVRWRPSIGVSLNEIARRLRAGRPCVLPRIHEGAILYDLRAVSENELSELAAAVVAAARP
jgi:L-seryl-tRNA(Ser) seleniumtransferase